MNTTYDETKFTELVVYVAERLRDDRSGGATKLNKVLFFADFAHVRRTGRRSQALSIENSSTVRRPSTVAGS